MSFNKIHANRIYNKKWNPKKKPKPSVTTTSGVKQTKIVRKRGGTIETIEDSYTETSTDKTLSNRNEKQKAKPNNKHVKDLMFKKYGEKQGFDRKIEELTFKLNTNLTASEKWFQNLYITRNLLDTDDVFSKAYRSGRKKFTPDVANYTHKYIIEIDGSIHDSVEQKCRDKRKDAFFRKEGFKVWRVKAFDSESFEQVIQYLLAYRATF